jgi:hypothetical protein
MLSHGRNGAAEWLSLAAAPVFLAMALLAAAPAGGHSMAGEAPPLGGMAAMYVLMALFHSPVWLQRIRRRSAAGDRG